MCEPIWIGRSAVLTKVSSPRCSGPRSALSSSSPGATLIAPGPVDVASCHVSPLLRRIGPAHWIGWCRVTSLRPSGKVASTWTSVIISAHSVHHLIAGQHLAAGAHQLLDPAAFAGPLDHPGAEQGDGLRVVELDAARQPVPGDHARHGHQQLLGVRRCQVHRVTVPTDCFVRRCGAVLLALLGASTLRRNTSHLESAGPLPRVQTRGPRAPTSRPPRCPAAAASTSRSAGPGWPPRSPRPPGRS